MDDRAFYVYAVATSLAQEGSDYLDCFWPIALLSVARAEDASLTSIQNAASTMYSLDIPQHVLATLLRRAEKKGYVQSASHEFFLSDKGMRYVQSAPEQNDIQRKVNALVDDVQQFITERQGTAAPSVSADVILSFLHKNLDVVLPYLAPGKHVDKAIASAAWSPEERLLMSYLHEADRAKPDQYKTLQDLVVGSLLTALLTTPDDSDVEAHSKSKFRDCTAYLDANIAIAMLGLTTSQFVLPAKELLSMLKKAGIHLRVYSFTVAEICRLVGAYPRLCDRYTTNVRVNDIYSDLKIAGWRPEDARMFVTHVDERLAEMGVEIENVPAVHLDDYVASRPELSEIIRKYKPKSDRAAINHDLAAIDQILLKRNGQRQRIETCGSLFLSSDVKLAKFNQVHYDHEGDSSIAEVIPDRVLATVLWLKSPTGTPPMQLILAACSTELSVQHHVWNHFYDVLSGLRRRGKLTDEDVSRIIYDPALEQTLSGFSEESEGTIDDSYILERAERAKQKAEKLVEQQIAARESSVRVEAQEMVRGMVSSAEEASRKNADQQWLQRIEKQREELRINSEAKGSRWASLLTALSVIIVLALSFPLRSLLSRMIPRDADTLAAYACAALWPVISDGLKPWLSRRMGRSIYARDARLLNGLTK